MSETVNGINVPFLPVGGVDGLKQKPIIDVPEERSFETVLKKELNGLKFSKHAQQRLDSRNIQLSDADMDQLSHAVDKADEKGAKDSLVLLREMAFVVSVKNRTVVTAMDSERMKDNVFTNIDSAIIASS
ncbi:MAG TPA: TIGR02530 family flagellar biosynthesis protein [Bacteroidota bacterium]|nr:TIGR02530 family flagellar biosynthesis protein [Bacteroidota bacterium]